MKTNAAHFLSQNPVSQGGDLGNSKRDVREVNHI